MSDPFWTTAGHHLVAAATRHLGATHGAPVPPAAAYAWLRGHATAPGELAGALAASPDPEARRYAALVATLATNGRTYSGVVYEALAQLAAGGHGHE